MKTGSFISIIMNHGFNCLIGVTLIIIILIFPLTVSSQNNVAKIYDRNIILNQKNILKMLKENRYRDIVIQTENNTRPYTSPDTQDRPSKRLSGVLLPEKYITVGKFRDKPVIFNILVDTITPLKYNATNKNYSGSFSIVLLEDSADVSSQKKLKNSVQIEVTTGSGALVNPSNIQIDHTNLPSTVIQITDNSMANPLPVHIKTSSNPAGYRVHLNKEARLSIETPARSIQGLGIQTIPINISLQNYGGYDAVNVSVDVNKGSVSPNKIQLKKDSSSTVMLTSESIGEAILQVTANGISSDQKSYKFSFPWIFLLFVIIGSFLGAWVKHLTNKGKKNFVRTIGLGVLTGFVFAILYYVLGIELFSIKSKFLINEFAVLGISFLGALFWGTIYDLIKTKLFGGKN
ncbi:MAG TPA: hypothetical protein PKN48_08615 [Bacteroidales bacterium]|nr:hypothetical protein [Bacteroidales bacterium]